MKSSLATKLALAISGLVFLVAAGGYPLTDLWHAAWRLPGHSELTPMFGSLYFVLGIFLLLALRNPTSYRVVIAFAAWSSLVHAAVMGIQWAQSAGLPQDQHDLPQAVALFVVLGLALLAVTPPAAPPAAISAA
ncbi:MAG: DUF6632 domain-containing protein [Terriglobales bacterium]